MHFVELPGELLMQWEARQGLSRLLSLSCCGHLQDLHSASLIRGS